ncbi:autophagy-related protein 13-like isoform X2 [Actinia tenebrosa]|uniref:Autophagy-related protein 13 n=1 Tax=Actinia tenebrosa TaxID=6105 RepID=A0A6P8IMP9_ACTTE|nr:autophagy-related protein 13-like isoform X2 [Actinia tenebrosa]
MDEEVPILGAKDQKDFDKFLKFLSFKAVQVIVQSRLGDKVHTRSKPNNRGQDWFNLAIDDMPEITSETKKSMGGNLPSVQTPMCIEISLQTSEGESMVLETWCLGINNKQDPHAKITFTVYNRMGMLLKSLISVARVTPSYRLARKQMSGDYVICYRIYFGDVRVKELGEGFQTVNVGSVGTPVGSVTLSAAYRTSLSMTGSQPAMPVKSDHYSSNSCQRQASWDSPVPCSSAAQAQFHKGAGVKHVADEIASASETEVTTCGRTPTHFKVSNRLSPTLWRNASNQRPNSIPQSIDVAMDHHAKGAFATSPVSNEIPLPALSSTPPFASLLSDRKSLGSRSDTTDGISRVTQRRNSTSSNRKDSSSESVDTRPPASNTTPSLWGGEDDFVLVELRPAFASSADGDLGMFYRECQTAPPLTLFQENKDQTLDTIMVDLDQQLSSYHECLPMFDELVANLQHSQTS